ncbi:hypothetical protein ACFQ9V_00890 [Leifsonia sp. NPDC056665]|uniref:hypothetical protein n=1 Tax=Leifsonia sp. NPDC056665 TaxID=3345901 RepID=UPI00367A1B86
MSRAIRERDLDGILAVVDSRSERDEASGCLIWKGNSNRNGYAYVLRNPGVYVHRVVCWASNGFPGDLSSFPPVHHLCGNTMCVNGPHLAPATALTNTIEASARTTLLRRIKALEAEINRLDPNNPVVRDWPAIEGGVPAGQIRVWRQKNMSMGESLRLQRRREAHAASIRERKQMRFEQVLQVRRLLAKGLTKKDATNRVGISYSTYDDWNRRYQDEIEAAPHKFVKPRTEPD